MSIEFLIILTGICSVLSLFFIGGTFLKRNLSAKRKRKHFEKAIEDRIYSIMERFIIAVWDRNAGTIGFKTGELKKGHQFYHYDSVHAIEAFGFRLQYDEEKEEFYATLHPFSQEWLKADIRQEISESFNLTEASQSTFYYHIYFKNK